MAQLIAIKLTFSSSDGARKNKLLTSQSGDDSIENFVRNIRREFEMREEEELIARVKLTFTESQDVGKFYH